MEYPRRTSAAWSREAHHGAGGSGEGPIRPFKTSKRGGRLAPVLRDVVVVACRMMRERGGAETRRPSACRAGRLAARVWERTARQPTPPARARAPAHGVRARQGGLPGREAPSYQRMPPPRGGSGRMRWHPGRGRVETASHRAPGDLAKQKTPTRRQRRGGRPGPKTKKALRGHLRTPGGWVAGCGVGVPMTGSLEFTSDQIPWARLATLSRSHGRR